LSAENPNSANMLQRLFLTDSQDVDPRYGLGGAS
jgi:hypothetical protein